MNLVSDPNPTLNTLVRYAEAVGKQLVVALADGPARSIMRQRSELAALLPIGSYPSLDFLKICLKDLHVILRFVECPRGHPYVPKANSREFRRLFAIHSLVRTLNE